MRAIVPILVGLLLFSACSQETPPEAKPAPSVKPTEMTVAPEIEAPTVVLEGAATDQQLANAVPAAAQEPAKSAEEIQTLYNRACIACHLSGAASAPRTHDVIAWESRLAKGWDELLASTKAGLNGMPPKGMCFDCTDNDFKALIKFMASPAPVK